MESSKSNNIVLNKNIFFDTGLVKCTVEKDKAYCKKMLFDYELESIINELKDDNSSKNLTKAKNIISYYDKYCKDNIEELKDVLIELSNIKVKNSGIYLDLFNSKFNINISQGRCNLKDIFLDFNVNKYSYLCLETYIKIDNKTIFSGETVSVIYMENEIEKEVAGKVDIIKHNYIQIDKNKLFFNCIISINKASDIVEDFIEIPNYNYLRYKNLFKTEKQSKKNWFIDVIIFVILFLGFMLLSHKPSLETQIIVDPIIIVISVGISSFIHLIFREVLKNKI